MLPPCPAAVAGPCCRAVGDCSAGRTGCGRTGCGRTSAPLLPLRGSAGIAALPGAPLALGLPCPWLATGATISNAVAIAAVPAASRRARFGELPSSCTPCCAGASSWAASSWGSGMCSRATTEGSRLAMLLGRDGAPPAGAAGCHATVLLVPPLPSASGSAAPRAGERFLDKPSAWPVEECRRTKEARNFKVRS